MKLLNINMQKATRVCFSKILVHFPPNVTEWTLHNHSIKQVLSTQIVKIFWMGWKHPYETFTLAAIWFCTYTTLGLTWRKSRLQTAGISKSRCSLRCPSFAVLLYIFILCWGYDMRAAVFIYADNTFGAGSGPVSIKYISCTGNEVSLWQCSISNNSVYYDRSAVAMRCENYPTNNGKCLHVGCMR